MIKKKNPDPTAFELQKKITKLLKTTLIFYRY